jgi:hypothetical protein
MQELISFLKTIWYDLDLVLEMPKEVGLAFGYTVNDIEFWDNGGYETLPPLKRFLFEGTRELRRYCRARSMTHP